MYNAKSRQPMDGGANNLWRIGNLKRKVIWLVRNEALFLADFTLSGRVGAARGKLEFQRLS